MNDSVNYGLMAIENSITGTLLKNYSLIKDSDARIIGEIFLRIQQNLLALPGVKIEDLKEVHSHPIALAQCESFFEAYPRSEEHTSELQSRGHLVCRLLLEKKKQYKHPCIHIEQNTNACN